MKIKIGEKWWVPYYITKKDFQKIWDAHDFLWQREAFIKALVDLPAEKPTTKYEILADILDELRENYPFRRKPKIYIEKIRTRIGQAVLEVFFRLSEKEWGFPAQFFGGSNHLSPSLRQTLIYFGYASEETKRGFKSQIRTLLRKILNCYVFSLWPTSDRKILARALVMNGLFEECVDHHIFEAKSFLKVLCLGEYNEVNGLKATQGLINKTSMQALKGNHNPHAWSALIRLMAMDGDIEFVSTLDPNADPNLPAEQRIKLALIFKKPEISGI